MSPVERLADALTIPRFLHLITINHAFSSIFLFELYLVLCIIYFCFYNSLEIYSSFMVYGLWNV